MVFRGFLFLVSVCATLAHAAVTSVEITERSALPVQNYERIVAKVHFAVDPKLPANKKIVDLNLAPRNAKGLVEFTADLLLLRPKDPAKRNGTMILESPNRGKTSLMNIGWGTTINPMKTSQDLGDPLFLEQGFTMAFLGWEFDVIEQPGAIKIYLPVIEGLTGPVMNGIVVNQKTDTVTLGGASVVPYPIADPSSGALISYDKPWGAGTTIPRSQWHFSEDGKSVVYPAGFEPGRLYHVTYTAKGAVPAGLGFAAYRDYVSYAKTHGEVARSIGFGISQVGRFMRTFLAEGYNVDENGKRVFDGVWAHIGGGSRGNFSNRFVQSSLGGGVIDATQPVYLPTYTPAELLAPSAKANVAPKLILTNSSYEYWNSNGSLVHTSLDGKMDVPPTGDARVYYVAGTQHASGSSAPGLIQYPPNTMDWRWFMRATMLSMNEWITKGTLPPPSRVPSIAKKELVNVADLAFPKIPGVTTPQSAGVPRRFDFGPDFLTKGIVSILPPKVLGTYVTLIPQVDQDGNEIAGVHMPDLSAPLATYTGWNLRVSKIGSPGERYGTIGSTFDFAATRSEREMLGDPRLSIEERYRDEHDYLTRVESAARQLVAERFVLERDVPAIVEHAKKNWESRVSVSAKR